jgi:putative ABC transport system permease protein
MTRVTLRGLLSRKLRASLTAVAVVLGVAMVSGTLVLTDTIEKAFDSIFSSSYEQTDAVVSGKKLVEWSQTGKATVSPAVLERIRALPEVESAAGTILDLSGDANQAKILDRDGEAIQGNNPTFGLGVRPEDERFNPFRLVEGDWASGPNEVVVDLNTADEQGFRVGESVRVAGEGPVRSYTLVGIARFGDVDSLGGATIALFDLPTAQRVLAKSGFDAVAVAARDGVDDAALVKAIEDVVPSSTVVRTGAEQAEEDGEGVGEFVTFIRYFLLAFGGIALFVGAFVIFNTLSITVAQRTKELATLRTLGASRRQVLRSVVLEGTVLGVVASAIGLGLGVLLARGLTALFGALDLEMPQADSVFRTRTAVVAMLTGTLVTLFASVWPAVRATRIDPISAVREGGLVVKKPSRKTLVFGLVVTALSATALVYGLLGSGVGAGARIAGIALGALGLFVGIAAIAPRLVRPLARVVGLPGARLGGTAGRLAQENAMRNPGRTASTAAALMIGLTLVSFVAVFGKALLASDESALRKQLGTSHVITSQSGWDTVPLAAGRAAASAPGVTFSSSIRGDRAQVVGNGEVDVSGVDPATIARAYNFEWLEGSSAALASLARGGAIVREGFELPPDGRTAHVGDRVTFLTPAGKRVQTVVRGVYAKHGDLDQLLGGVVLSQATFDASFPRPGDSLTLVQADSTAALDRALAAFPDAKLQTGEEFIDSRTAWLNDVMSLFYVLLALSVIVSLFGMVNTLVLAVFERTREVGMLRAVGMTRRQVRRMIRHEAVTTALIGAALGIPLGVALGALVTQSMSEYGVSFALPVGPLVAFTIVAVVAGVLAAIVPARRASRLNVLEALQYE